MSALLSYKSKKFAMLIYGREIQIIDNSHLAAELVSLCLVSWDVGRVGLTPLPTAWLVPLSLPVPEFLPPPASRKYTGEINFAINFITMQ